jgi:hypothetical protein
MNTNKTSRPKMNPCVTPKLAEQLKELKPLDHAGWNKLKMIAKI